MCGPCNLDIKKARSQPEISPHRFSLNHLGKRLDIINTRDTPLYTAPSDKMGLKDSLKTLSGKVNSKGIAKLTAEFPDNVTTKDNVIKTDDLRIDVHRNFQYPEWATARIQANTKAKDPGVKALIKKGNKGSGSHSGTHKIIAEIQYDRTNFNAEDFTAQVREAYRVYQEDEDNDNGEGSSKGNKGKKSK